MDVIKYIKEHYNWHQFENFIRVNKVVDIYKSKKKKKITVFVLPEKKYYYPKNENELADLLINSIEFYKKEDDDLEEEDEGFVMNFGKYKGKNIKEVPAEYLIWMFDNIKTFGPVKKYIQQNEKSLRDGKKR